MIWYNEQKFFFLLKGHEGHFLANPFFNPPVEEKSCGIREKHLFNSSDCATKQFCWVNQVFFLAKRNYFVGLTKCNNNIK